MGNTRWAVLAAALFACGGGTQATKPDPGKTAANVKTYEPLGSRKDSKDPSQAIILGTDDKNGSTILPLPVSDNKALVDAMYIRSGGGVIPTGGFTPVKLQTGPNPDRSVQVGIFEEMSGGTGPQWRAGVWVSAFVAATTLNKDLTDFTFSAASGGYIDGASASGLMAGGFLAAMTGNAVDPTTTMTGIINPDGTIGPVAGIPEKFLGSIEKGKKRLGYPIGMRFTRSEASGQTVDLVQLAKDHGAEAIEIANVHEAYKLLTGKTLPEPVPVAEADMALDPGTTKALEPKYVDWQGKVAAEWQSLLQLNQAGRLPATLVTMATMAQDLATSAEKLHKQGKLASAYTKMLGAWVYAASATDTYDVLSKVQAGDLDGAVKAIAALEALDTTVEVFHKIGAIKPTTLGGHLLMIAAFESALRGWGFKAYAVEQITSTKEYLRGLAGTSKADLGSTSTAESVVAKVAPTVALIGRTIAETSLALQQLDFEAEQSVNYMCSIPNVKRMSTSFQSASAAGLTYFDTLVGVSDEYTRRRVELLEPDYLVAMMNSKLNTTEGMPTELKTLWGEKSLAWGLMSLAGSELAYHDSAQLIAKYYSLHVRNDLQGKVESVEHDKAFVNMLASAERTARASARSARIATGAIPVQAKLAYQLAAVERDGDLGERIDALNHFWASSAYSQTAVMLARN
jgi:uncharacterized protein